MISGHLQGKLLEFLSRMIQPAAILEIGTYTGYSALCLAKGLKPGGKLHTIEINDELQPFIETIHPQSRSSGNNYTSYRRCKEDNPFLEREI